MSHSQQAMGRENSKFSVLNVPLGPFILGQGASVSSLPSAKSLPADFGVLRSSGSSLSCLSQSGDGDPAQGGTKLLFFPRASGDVSVQGAWTDLSLFLGVVEPFDHSG